MTASQLISRIVFAVLMFLTTLAPKSDAAAPTAIKYQGRLTATGGGIVPDGTYQLVFKIYDAPLGGVSKWTESQSVTTTEGLFSVLLGIVNPVVDSVFKDTVRYLAVQIGNEPELLPRTRIVSVPYAARISTVDGATGGTIISKISVGPGHTNTGTNAFVAGEGNVVSGDWSAVSGGVNNSATSVIATVGGGQNNTANASQSTVGGGAFNMASNSYATVAGGNSNVASGEGAAVGGGTSNYAISLAASVGGGTNNVTAGDSSAIGGGAGNYASGSGSNIDGGISNISSGQGSSIGGGKSNYAIGIYSRIGGGLNNQIASSGSYATIGGGVFDTVSGHYGTIPGGFSNKAGGNHSFAAGRRAKALHFGTFVWADSSADLDFASTKENQFLIRAAGGVGIGTNSPSAQLQVNGDVHIGSVPTPAIIGSSENLYVANTLGDSKNSFRMDGYANDFAIAANSAAGASSGASISFRTGNAGAGESERMRIASNGNIGIGSGNPSEKLSVAGSMEIGTSSGDYQHLRVGGGNSSGFLYGSYPAFGDGIHMGYNFYADAAGNSAYGNLGGATSRLSLGYGYIGMYVGGIAARPLTLGIYLNNSGNVGVGTNAPAYRLDVAGSAHATSFPTSSDNRLKKNVRPLEHVLEKIAKIRGVSFDWNETYEQLGRSSGHREIGVIAQEVEMVFPELVTTWGESDYRAVDYGRLSAVLIEAIKAQQVQIELLKDRIAKLEKAKD